VIGGATVALLAACAAAVLLRRRQKQQRHPRRKDSSLAMRALANPLLPHTSQQPLSRASGGGGGGGGSGGGRSRARDFALPELAAATDGFAPRFKLAEGAFGAVYRGELQPSGKAVAIKVLTRKDDPDAAPSDYSGAGSFALEAKVLGQYRHANIVGLLGQCLGDAQPLQYLVYEFMAGGSLHERLDPEGSAAPLTWQQRHVVASDAARGLEYLHVDADPPIVHQDVKSDNILLGENAQGQVVAKIADFGAVRIAPKLLTSTHVSTLDVIGTKPYQPPEYAMSGHVSEKTDTFAFGVVLLELLTAKPPSNPETSEFLYCELGPVLEDLARELLGALDARLKKKKKKAQQWPLSQALALAVIARRCLEMAVRKRCTVSDVLVELDVLAGRRAIQRAGRGQEYDPMTGELVSTGGGAAAAQGGGSSKGSGRESGGGACPHCGAKLRFRQGVALACFTCRR
jgi:serine/threonine protein kinase